MRILIMLTLMLSMFTCETHSQNNTITEQGVTLIYPKGWVKEKLPGHAIYIRQQYLKKWSIRATFDVEIHDDINDLKMFIKNYKKKMKKNSKFFRIITEKNIIYKGYSAIELVCLGFIKNTPMKWKTIMFLKNGKLYKFTTTNSLGEYPKTMWQTEDIFESAVIK